ncbi:MAG TPA: phosphate ABC transporter substrate-binding protein PstS [Candidatus Binataceae bacterium]|nr:phosphate ABC transporter substrate-binding protein PstS [Candidatus Binataceae bacterium]
MKKVSGISLCLGLLLGALTAAVGNGPLERRGVAFAAENITLQGTGATFPAPLYQRWFSEYNKLHPEVQINYQPLGSGAGVKQFQQGLVNFGASDAAMTDAEIKAVKDGVVLLPMTAGSIVLAYNIPGALAEVKLSREAYSGIFLGKITSWDDPAIAKANPGAKLPSTKITVVTRSDGSGTTFVFTTHLSAISPEWKAGPGAGKSVNFPVGVAGKGNPGVTALIKQTPGAIGYVEYGYAKQTGMPMAELENHNGKFVKADLDSGKNALATVALPADLRAWIPDPQGDAAYPIVTYTWLLCYKKYQDPKIAQTLKSVIQFGLTDGQKDSVELGYIPLPPNVVTTVSKAAEQIS